MNLNIMYCGNDKVFDGMLISLLSIIRHTNSPVHVYTLTMDLVDLNPTYKPIPENDVLYLDKMVKETNPESFVKLIDMTELFKGEMGNSPNLSSSYTPYCLLRMLADLIPDLPDTLLYLDTDTIIRKDISALFEMDLTGYDYAGTLDFLGKFFIRYNYQNSGVLLLNMPQIKKSGLFEKVRQRCNTKKMAFPDQTALNFCVEKKKFLPSKYNEQRLMHKDTVIHHFCKSIRWLPFYHTVNIKPWEIEKIHSVYKIHEYDDILDEYVERKKRRSAKNTAVYF